METDDDQTDSTETHRDDLERIHGIGPRYAAALDQIGVRRFADLARYTPEELSDALREQSGVNVAAERIDVDDWIGQAESLSQPSNLEPPVPDEAEQPPEAEDGPSRAARQQQAGFSLFFDYTLEEDGERSWQTRVYHDESGQERLFAGVDPDLWVQWILEQAELSDALDLALSKPEADEPIATGVEAAPEDVDEEAAARAPTMAAPYDAQIAGLTVEVSEVAPAYEVHEKQLMAHVKFQIDGPEAHILTADEITARIEVHIADLEDATSNVVASEQINLQPEVFEYSSEQPFVMPPVGRYEVHTLVLLLPPGEMMAYYRGPILNIVP